MALEMKMPLLTKDWMKQHQFLDCHSCLTRLLSDSLCCCPGEVVHVNDGYLDHAVSVESFDTLTEKR